jgi:predicted nucleic acid-binding Zn ribbon protein
MPIYVYEEILPDGQGGEQYELFQKMNDPHLENHPDNGKPIRRILAAPSIGGIWSDAHANKSLSDKNLKEKGFTKYVKTGDGTYEKVVGNGPTTISGNDD